MISLQYLLKYSWGKAQMLYKIIIMIDGLV